MESPDSPHTLALATLLRHCAQQVADDVSTTVAFTDLDRAGRRFLDGGLAALDMAEDDGRWLQYNVALAGADRLPAWHAGLRETAAALLAGDADDFFFMNKPPGMRVRFRPVDGRRDDVDRAVRDWLAAQQADGTVRAWRPSLYEPEYYLFGGPASMRHVHRVFTADAMLWLAYKALGDDAGPSWALSFSALSTVFAALRIGDGEDLDAWDRVRWQTGRRLNAAQLEAAGSDLQVLTTALRQGWKQQATLLDKLAPQLHGPVEEFHAQASAAAQAWRTEYFLSADATLGPRAAVAYYVIFHWNRGAVPFTQQCLITEAMAAHPALRRRPTDPALATGGAR